MPRVESEAFPNFGGWAIRLTVAKPLADPAKAGLDILLLAQSRSAVNAHSARTIDCAMPEESLRFFVERRERELVNRLDFARAQVNQLMTELAEVRRAKEALEPIETVSGVTGVLAAHEERDTPLVLATVSDETMANTMADSVFCNNCGEPIKGEPPITDDLAQRPPCHRCGSTARTLRLQAGRFGFAGSASTNPYPGVSIKRLILLAFSDKREFRYYGAKASQIREFIRDAYGRDIDRATLSPQITRLQRDGLIKADGGGVWRLAERPGVWRFKGGLNTDEAATGNDPDSAPESPDVGK
jgi:hypothetical protein